MFHIIIYGQLPVEEVFWIFFQMLSYLALFAYTLDNFNKGGKMCRRKNG